MVEQRTPQANHEGTQPFEEALDALRKTLDDESDTTSNSWRRDITFIGLLAAVFGVVAWYALLEERDQATTVQIALSGALSEELAWVQPGFEQVLVAYAHAGDRLRLNRQLVQEGTQPSNTLFGLGSTTSQAQATLNIELVSQTSSDVLLAKLQLTHGDAQHEAILTGYPTALADLASRTSLQVFTWLGIDPYTSGELAVAQGEFPANPQAGQHYALGVQALLEGEGRKATTELELALGMVPDHPMINAALAETYEFLGYAAKAVEHIKVAFTQRDSLSREKQLAIEARMRLLENTWVEAETLYAALTAFYPEEISYGLALAEAQFLGSRIDESLETIARLRGDASFADDPRVDLVEARLWRRTGDWSKGVEAAKQAVEKAQALGNSGVLARALVAVADMDGDRSGAGLALAQQIAQEMGDLYGQSQVIGQIGDRHRRAGRLAEAIAAYDQAEEMSRSLGNEASVAEIQQVQAIVLDLNGELEAGYRTKLALLESNEARGISAKAAIVMENLGISAMKLGRLEEALSWFDQALPGFVEHTDLIGIAWYPYQRGRVLARMGSLEQARVLFGQALENAKAHPEGYLELHTLYEIARLDVFERQPGVGELLRRLIDQYDEEGLHLDTGDTLLVLARHEAMTSKLDSARQHVERAREIFAESDARYYLTRAETIGVQLGDLQACESLDGLARTMQHRQVAMLATVALQRCDGRDDDISGLLDDARQLKLFEPELALTALVDVQAAQQLADAQGWVANDYWVQP